MLNSLLHVVIMLWLEIFIHVCEAQTEVNSLDLPA